MLLNESPYGAGIFPILCTIRQVLRRSFRLIANAIPLPMILRRSFRFPNDRFGLNENWEVRIEIIRPPGLNSQFKLLVIREIRGEIPRESINELAHSRINEFRERFLLWGRSILYRYSILLLSFSVIHTEKDPTRRLQLSCIEGRYCLAAHASKEWRRIMHR